jgi:multidrug efflux pump subunit AcrA (membrane-fusion protein)
MNRKRWLIVIAAVVVVALVAVVWRVVSEPEAAPETEDFTVQATTMTLRLGATGTIQPAQRSDLAFTSSGTVTQVNVSVGDRVVAGQPLAAIGLTDLQDAVDAARSELDAARADLGNASGETARASAQSNLKVRENALANAQQALEEGTLKSPFDGTVALVNVKPGDQVSGGAASSFGSLGDLTGIDLSGLGGLGDIDTSGLSGGNSGSGSTGTTARTAITVISTGSFLVETSVSGADVGKLAKEQSVAIVPEGTSDTLSGKIVSVGVMATAGSSGDAEFPVVVAIDGDHPELFAGISAELGITYETKTDVLAVPSTAITQNEAGDSVVQVRRDGQVTEQVVQDGVSADSMTEITSGLTDGDVVVVTVTHLEADLPWWLQGSGGSRESGPSVGVSVPSSEHS